MESTTTDSMCRCCAAEGIFKDIKTSYHWMGEEEVYGDMLRECFDVKLAAVEEGGICEVCITQLRNAANFKKQVLHTEKKFKRHLENRRFKPTEVKEEVSGDNGNSSDDNDRGVDSEDDEDYVPEFEIPIKTESPEETKSRKRAAKATTSRAKKSRSADAEDKSSPGSETVPATSTAISENPRREMTTHQKKVRDIKQVLLSSNATPVWSYAKWGYKCSYCELSYPHPDRLKKHTLEEHDDITEALFLRSPRFYELVIKLDITSLTCKLCGESSDSLNTLIQHLNSAHNKRIDAEITSRFLPFRTHSKSLQCGICTTVFATFANLEHHLNVHMKIYHCSACNEAFKMKAMLQLHNNIEHKKNHPQKKVKQTNSNKVYVCPECGETFPTEYYRRIHVKEMHREPVFYECKICDRVYSRPDLLRVHTRRDHMMERRFQCSVCGKEFYSKETMRKHGLSHSTEKIYSCDECGKRFKFKTSLRPHMLIHRGIRNFECKVCHQKFVQKASWQGHMRSRHNMIV